jgi:predicted DNA-binding transcriptional regulator YafY
LRAIELPHARHRRISIVTSSGQAVTSPRMRAVMMRSMTSSSSQSWGVCSWRQRPQRTVPSSAGVRVGKGALETEWQDDVDMAGSSRGARILPARVPETIRHIADSFVPRLVPYFAAMLTTSARLLRLLSLLQARRYWSGSDLAGRLEVTGRTLRRDVERLRSLGYPVHSTSGIAGGYRLGAGAALPPLLLEDDEALAVSVGLRTAAGGTVAGLEEVAVRALAKLEQVLPSRLRRRVTALHSSIVPMANIGPTVDPGHLAIIAIACRDHERLKFQYRSHDGSASERNVEPSGLVHTGRRWYLVAWDVGRGDWRTFRVDRIQRKVSTGARFVPRDPPDGDLAAYVSRSMATVQYSFRARVILHASLEAVAEKVSSAAGRLEAIDERSCELHTGAHSLDALAMWISLIGVDFEVRDPPELVDHLRRLGDRLLRATAAADASPDERFRAASMDRPGP